MVSARIEKVEGNETQMFEKYGAPGGIRTPDPLVRSPALEISTAFIQQLTRASIA